MGQNEQLLFALQLVFDRQFAPIKVYAPKHLVHNDGWSLMHYKQGNKHDFTHTSFFISKPFLHFVHFLETQDLQFYEHFSQCEFIN